MIIIGIITIIPMIALILLNYNDWGKIIFLPIFFNLKLYKIEIGFLKCRLQRWKCGVRETKEDAIDIKDPSRDEMKTTQ